MIIAAYAAFCYNRRKKQRKAVRMTRLTVHGGSEDGFPMVRSALALVAVCAVATLTAAPQATVTGLAQNGGNKVTVGYTLSGGPGIVTVDFLTNGVSIGAQNFADVSGDVNRLVADGAHEITWKPYSLWPGEDAENLSAQVTVWATNAPPDYLVYDFVGHATNFYTCVEALPDGGLANNIYKTDRIVLRRIPAKGVSWLMGSSATEVWGGTDIGAAGVSREVTLTRDYYMAIYEITQAQYRHAGGTTTSSYSGEDADLHPVEKVASWELRGSSTSPANTSSGLRVVGGFLATMRTRTGIAFDLPTEAEWEFACRAGTRTSVNTGVNLVNKASDPGMEAVAWTQDNATSTHVVGEKPANAWGLYDMHGNVSEWCADWYGPLTAGAVIDPAGPLTAQGSDRCLRGGGWAYSRSNTCRSGHRSSGGTAGAVQDRGFRVMCPVALKW